MMLNNTMDYSKPIADLSEKFSFGGMMLLIGVAAVFAVLTIIWLALTIFSAAFRGASNKSAKDTKVTEPEPIVAPSSPDEEIVAVIAAAIAMAESESDGIKFKVVSFKRV